MTVNLSFPGHGTAMVWLVKAGSAQDLTSNWVDLGDQQFVSGAEIVSLWLDIDVNDSRALEVQFLASHEDGGDAYFSLIRPDVELSSTPGSPDDVVSDEEDFKVIMGWRLHGMITYIQFQVRVQLPGDTTGGQILSAGITTHR